MEQPVEVAKAPCVQLGWHKRVGTKGFALAVGHPSTSSLHQEGFFWGREGKSGGISPGRSIVVVCSGAWLLPGLSKQELEHFFRLQNHPKVPKTPKVASQICSRGGYNWWNDAPRREGR